MQNLAIGEIEGIVGLKMKTTKIEWADNNQGQDKYTSQHSRIDTVFFL